MSETKIEIKIVCAEYAQLRKEVEAYKEIIASEIEPLQEALVAAQAPIKEQIEAVNAVHTPKLESMGEQLRELEECIKKHLAEQIVLENGVKVNVAKTQSLDVKNDLGLFTILQKQAPKVLGKVKFNFAQCKIPALVEAGVVFLDAETAELNEKKSVRVTYPKK